MEQIHTRLKAELVDRGLSAAEAARQAGEADSQGLRDVLAGRKRLSADLLGALTVATGIDAVFVLTGVRGFERPVPVSSDLRTLIADYDACTAKDQAALRRTAAAMALGNVEGGATKKAKKAEFLIEGNVGAVVKARRGQKTVVNMGAKK